MGRHYYDYIHSQHIAVHDWSFYALLMAAMRVADSTNADKLMQAFPSVHAELVARYNAPGGLLPGENDPNDDLLSGPRAAEDDDDLPF